MVFNVPSLPYQVSFQAIGTGSGILGYRRCWCPLLFPFCLPYLCFSIHSSPAIRFHSYFFLPTDVSALIRSTLHLLMVSFQA